MSRLSGLAALSALVGGLVAAAATVATAATAAQPASGTVHGCPRGDVCIYPRGAGWNGGHPGHTYTAYGPHDLHGAFGTHYVLNNQTQGATVGFCTSPGGANCAHWVKPGDYLAINLTPINSIDLATAMPGPSKLGGTISKAEVRKRLMDWYHRRPSYSQAASDYWDLGDTRKYRRDCSGSADMAFHINGDYNTASLPTSGLFTLRFNIHKVPRSRLNPHTVQTGDLFDDVADGHAFVFLGWNKNGSFNYFNFGGGNSGVAPPEYHTGAHMTDKQIGYEPTGHYKIYRYKHIS